MCDGVIQGQDGMELFLFFCDVIVMVVVVGLLYQMFDVVVFFGICDKIVLGFVIVVFFFGYLLVVFILVGLMIIGIFNDEKVKVCQFYVEGKVGCDVLLELEFKVYYLLGICIFYGMVNFNQMLMEIMGLYMFGFFFVNLGILLCDVLICEVIKWVLVIFVFGNEYMFVGEIIDEKVIVNGVVGFYVMGGLINYIMYLVVIVVVVGIKLIWDDIFEFFDVVLLLVWVYLNGKVDVNYFQVVGGLVFLICELFGDGYLYQDVKIVYGMDLFGYMVEVGFDVDGNVIWQLVLEVFGDEIVLVLMVKVFQLIGGLKVLSGNIGKVVIKILVVVEECYIIEVLVCVFEFQDDFFKVFNNKELIGDVVVVV